MWDDKKKVDVVTTWLAVGKMPLVEALTGVPSNTLRAWKQQPWWGDLVREIQTESDQELDTKLATIVDKSLAVVLDRIENGDFVLNSKTGEVTRIPTKLKDVHRVSVDLIDKRDLIRKRPELLRVDVTTVDDYLKKLAAQFTEFVKRKLPKTLEGEAVAIHEEGPKDGQDGSGLPQGSGPVHQPSGSNQEAGPAERSPHGNGS